MKRYSKIHKVIALWNSYNSLINSDFIENPTVQGSIAFCLNEIERLGYEPYSLPVDMDGLILYLKNNK